jgi:GMP synthase-like glutamine amidotransferase
MKDKKLKLALLDMNNGFPNQGMRCLRKIIAAYANVLDYEEFDVRQKNELPDLSFDMYISSGGPGNPLEDVGPWLGRYKKLIDELWANNLKEYTSKKYAFFICHSFQLVSHHFKLGEITKRKSTSFGVYPIHKAAGGKKDLLLARLADQYFAVDSRDYQLIQPRLKVFKERGASILSLEKIRTNVEYERAIMAVRFSKEFVGTQFHPEADPEGMKTYFQEEVNRNKVILNFGEEKYQQMMEQLDDPEKIHLTHSTLLPGFIEMAVESLQKDHPKMVLA